MKKYITLFLWIILPVTSSFAAYTYIVDSYSYVPSLHASETLLMIDEGGTNSLFLNDSSSATIQNTSLLEQGVGGIWHMSLYDSSHTNILGGQIHQLTMNSNATAILKRGLIEEIWSYQQVPIQHIKLYYSGDLPNYNETTDILTGLWGNGDPFSIYLHDVSGYAPVIDNIDFVLIPEPAGLTLLALGGLLVKRKR